MICRRGKRYTGTVSAARRRALSAPVDDRPVSSPHEAGIVRWNMPKEFPRKHLALVLSDSNDPRAALGVPPGISTRSWLQHPSQQPPMKKQRVKAISCQMLRATVTDPKAI